MLMIWNMSCVLGWVTIPGQDGCCIVNSTMMKTTSTVKKAMTTSTIMTIITAIRMANIGKDGHGFDSVEHHNQKNDAEYWYAKKLRMLTMRNMFLDTKKHLCFWDGAPCLASKLAPRIPTDHLAVAQAPTTNSWLHNSLVIMGNPRGFSDWLHFLLSTGNLRKNISIPSIHWSVLLKIFHLPC